MTRNQAIVDANGVGLVTMLGNIYQQWVEQSMPLLIVMTNFCIVTHAKFSLEEIERNNKSVIN